MWNEYGSVILAYAKADASIAEPEALLQLFSNKKCIDKTISYMKYGLWTSRISAGGAPGAEKSLKPDVEGC
jgi:hypothetical protein